MSEINSFRSFNNIDKTTKNNTKIDIIPSKNIAKDNLDNISTNDSVIN